MELAGAIMMTCAIFIMKHSNKRKNTEHFASRERNSPHPVSNALFANSSL